MKKPRYPFLRNFYTLFDFDNKRLGFVKAADVDHANVGGIELKGIRPT